MLSTISRCPIQKLEDSTYNFKKRTIEMHYNYIYFHLQKLQLGPIDAAFQELQYALNNSVRALLTAAVPLEAPSLVSFLG
jgi:hypothetical protein